MKSTARTLSIILITMLATTAFAQALPGSVEKATNFFESLLKAKWVMVAGGAMIMGYGWRVYKGQLTLEEFAKTAVALVLVFGGLPIGYALYQTLST